MSVEGVIGTLHEVRGHTHDALYDLVVSERGVVVVIVNSPADTPVKISPLTWLVGQGRERHREKLRRQQRIQERREAYQQQDLREVVDAHEGNYRFSYGELDALVVRTRWLSGVIEVVLARPDRRAGRRTQFEIRKDQVAEARQLFSRVAPSLVRE